MIGSRSLRPARDRPESFAPVVAAFLAAATAGILAIALAFQYLGAMVPCELCHLQRYPYLAAGPLALAALLLPAWRGPLLAAAGLGFLGVAGIAGFHVGVEQHWWSYAGGCSFTPGSAGNAEALMQQILKAGAVRCDEAAWTLLGISMAGYNFILAVCLAATAAVAAWPLLRGTRRSPLKPEPTP